MKKIFITVAVLICISCSSAPKKPTEITLIRRQAEQELDLGNKAMGQEQFDNALLYLSEAKRKSISVDDSSLIIRTSISLGNVLLSIGRTEEAFKEWDTAIAEGQRSGNLELLSVSRIYRARGSFLTGKESPTSVLELLNREQPNIKDRYYTAFLWQVKGLVQRAMGLHQDAENSLLKSLEIHEKDRYLEDASYDWYTIASIRSLAGNLQGAIKALEESIAIDRRIENSWGLAASWRAMGDVLRKAGRTSEAEAAYARSHAIIDAIN